MNREILRDVNFDVTEEEIFRQLKMLDALEDEDYADDVDEVRGMLAQAKEIANPKALIEVLAIEARDEKLGITCVRDAVFTSSFVFDKLKDVNKIVAYVFTCGIELEEWSKMFTDPLEQYWADGIKLVYLGKMGAYMSRYVKEKYFENSDMSALNPGSLAAWPLSEQAPLFSALGNVKQDTGIDLTDSYLMVPSKSGSGIYFSAAEHHENCSLCPIEDCPNRRAKRKV